MTESKAAEDAILPCPFCNSALIANDNQDDMMVRRYGTHYQHPQGTCILSDQEVTPSDIAWWNQRAPDHRIAALEAENAALRKDAERYRWLRDGELVAQYPYPVMRCGDGTFDRSIWAEELDAAIDEARAR